jgi:hypothetical protein
MHIINVFIWNTTAHHTVKTPINWTPPPWYPLLPTTYTLRIIMSLIVRYAIIGHYNNEANLLSLSISHNLIVHEIFQIFYLLYYEIWIYKIVFIICVTVSIYHCWCMNTYMCEIIHHQLESWSTSIWHHIYHLFLLQ